MRKPWGEAEFIVTFNLVDFPSDALAPYNVQALHPDGFLSDLFDAAPDGFCSAAHLQRVGLKNPPKTVGEFLDTLGSVGLAQTAARLRVYSDRI